MYWLQITANLGE